jgi:transcriptional regulator GlxA family with amidase domain
LSNEARDPVDEAVHLIAAAPAQPWTVESLARAVGMGRSNFAAHFSQRIDKAPMEVVAEHRMEHAARLLREGRMKIVEIAELAGYGSEAAFSRRFSRHFALSPSQLREQARASAVAAPPPRVRSLLSETPRPTAARPRRVEEPAPTTGDPPATTPFFARAPRG